MPVVVEGIGLVLNAEKSLTRFPKLREMIEALIPDTLISADGELVSLNFYHPEEVKNFSSLLSEVDLQLLSNGKFDDYAIVDELKGCTKPCDWIEVYSKKLENESVQITCCRLSGSKNQQICFPPGWKAETARSRRDSRTPLTENEEVLWVNDLRTNNENEQQVKYTPTEGTHFGTLDATESPSWEFPQGLFHIAGSLLLRGSKLKAMPESLIVDGDLDISYSEISSIYGADIQGTLHANNSMLTELPDIVYVGDDVEAENSHLRSISRYANLMGSLYLSGTQIEHLPDDWIVHGDLELDRTPLRELPHNLSVEGSLSLMRTNITHFPASTSVGYNLWLSGSRISELPDGMTIHGSLDLSETKIEKLPSGLHVMKTLNLRGTKIKELPNDLVVRGDVVVSGSQVRTEGTVAKIYGQIITDDV